MTVLPTLFLVNSTPTHSHVVDNGGTNPNTDVSGGNHEQMSRSREPGICPQVCNAFHTFNLLHSPMVACSSTWLIPGFPRSYASLPSCETGNLHQEEFRRQEA